MQMTTVVASKDAALSKTPKKHTAMIAGKKRIRATGSGSFKASYPW
jgi:hypothetical protein